MSRIIFVIFIVINLFADEMLLKPLPQTVAFDKQKAQLGKKLFFDTRLSHDDTIACISCHNLYNGGADTTAVSFGVGGAKGSINSPSVYNARYNIAQFWDGRAKDLKEQAVGPLFNPVEMASSKEEIIEKLQKDKEYQQTFQKIYKDGVTLKNIVDAIVEFEKALITPNAKFDRYLNGEADSLTEKEKKGYTLFQDLGCISCHNGVNIGGNMFQKFGVFKQQVDNRDLGRFNVTNDPLDKHYFKVPSLRNVALTAPYFHNGSATTLKDAIKKMGLYQLGQELSSEQIDAIEAFLHTLTGKIPTIVEK